MPKRGSCGSVLPGCRLSKRYSSINSPAARCCTSRARRDAHCTLLGSPLCRDTRRLVLASRLPSRAAPTCDPHSARCLAGAQFPATSCLGAFRPPATSSCGGSRDPGVRKPAQQQKTHDQSSSSPERGFVWFKMRPDPNRSYSRCQTCAVFDLNSQTA
jgi:hypothetical protein